MKQLSKVVWAEGMHLSQHHFQTQTRYFEDSIHFALSQLFSEAFGLAGIELDAEALRNGTVALLHARGVLPDGLPFNIPQSDPAPAPRAIADVFSPTVDAHRVMLAIPAHRIDGPNTADSAGNGGPRPRYVAAPAPRLDETSGRDERPVPLGRKNFRLLLDAEVGSDEVALPLARVRRDGSGHFVWDETYIPPVLQIGASETLVRLLARVIEVLEAKAASLTAARQAGTAPQGDVATLWLLHAIHASLGPLKHHFEARSTRPDALFVELSRLAGALCTFSLDAHPRGLPAYDIDDLEGSFGALERHILRHLGIAAPTSAVTIRLEPVAAFLYNGTVTDRRVLGASRWILGIGTGLPPAEVITRAPQLVKVCSAKFVPELVRRAYPGLALVHLPVPPASALPTAGVQYFEITRQGPCWDTIVQTGAVGVYVPDALPQARIELKVVLE